MRRALSVRFKILLTVAASVIALSGLLYVISDQVLYRAYLAIEREEMVGDLRRASDAIGEFSNQQRVKLADWAGWDEAYEYVLTRDPQWAEETIYPLGLANLDINLMAWSDLEGQVFKLMVADIESGEEIASSSEARFFASEPGLITHTQPGQKTQGIVTLPKGPLILVSLPSLTSEGEGPVNGSITFGRYLDERKIADLSEVTHLAMSVYSYASADLPEDVAAAKQVLMAGAKDHVEPVADDLIRGYTLIYDLYETPALILKVETPRPIYAQAQFTFLTYLVVGTAALLLFGFAVIFMLERLVVSRFVRLTRQVEAVNDERDLSIRVEGGVRDDIGMLADKINQMLSWLSESRSAEAAARKEVEEGKERAEEMVATRTRELSEEKARLLASINSLTFGFVVAEEDHRIALRNPALSELLPEADRVSTVEELAKTLSNFDLMAFVRSALDGRKLVELKELAHGKSVLRLMCAPVFPSRSQEAAGYVLLIEDITEAKVIERSREEFFSIASHELRTPLTAIRGNASLLLRLKDGEGREEMLQDIESSATRLISLVNDFLEVSRLEQGKIEIAKAEVDVMDAVRKAARNLAELVNERGLTLIVEEPSAPLPKVQADPARLEQVLDNVIGNAAKFTSKGSITVSAHLEGAYVKVRVKDTGSGIAEKNQTLLFRKFQQAGESLLVRNASQSSGLGLYISKLIMEAMGGDIVLEESVPGKGSTFAFTLPLA